MTVLLYTYFFNISLNVQDQPFLRYVICLFYALQISVKLGSKLGQKLTTFPTLWAPAPTELQFSVISVNSLAKFLEPWKLQHQILFKTRFLIKLRFIKFLLKSLMPNKSILEKKVNIWTSLFLFHFSVEMK